LPTACSASDTHQDRQLHNLPPAILPAQPNAANKDSTSIKVRSKAFRKLDRQFWGKGLTNDAANAGDADLQRFHELLLDELNIWKLAAEQT
jgi:hypothetical protein